MNIFASLYERAGLVRDHFGSLLSDHSMNDEITLEVGAPSMIDDGPAVALIFRSENGSRLPVEVIVFDEGIAIVEALDCRVSGTTRHYLGRLRPLEDTGRLAEKVMSRLKVHVDHTERHTPSFRR